MCINEKVAMNSKYYHEQQRTCVILIMLTYLALVTSKLPYLPMDLDELLDILSSFAPGRLFPIIFSYQDSKVNLKLLNILVKGFN